MGESRNRIYLVHIKLAQSDAATIRARVPLLHSAISSLSDQMAPAYSSADAGTFGFLITSGSGAHAIRYDIENGAQDGRDSGFRRGDSVLVLEIGEHASQLGFSRAQDFVQKWYGK